MILIGMSGIDERFRHYPRLYGRLGLSSHYRAPGPIDLALNINQPDTITDDDVEAAASILVIGNEQHEAITEHRQLPINFTVGRSSS